MIGGTAVVESWTETRGEFVEKFLPGLLLHPLLLPLDDLPEDLLRIAATTRAFVILVRVRGSIASTFSLSTTTLAFATPRFTHLVVVEARPPGGQENRVTEAPFGGSVVLLATYPG